jgi:uncharacterized repeat protein (TIGR01451 family)
VAYRGVEGLRVDEDGALVIRTAFGELKESPPTIYQEIDGKRIAVTGRFKLLGPTAYTFEVGPYQQRYALVIDPTLVYATYLGGSLDDNALGIAVDGNGHAYVAGSTHSTNFPTLNGLFPYNGGSDIFVTRLNRAGTALQFSAYVGGSGDDTEPAIAIDAAGGAYVVGSTTSTDFPPLNALQPSPGGGRDAFVFRIDPAGVLGYSTYLGGAGDETGVGIAVDPSCANPALGCGVYVSGTTASAFLPASGFQPIFGGVRDAFIVRLDANGSRLASTYLGGSGAEDAGVLAVGADGTVYVTGQTSSTNFPKSANALQSSLNGAADAFIVKLSADLSTRLYATYFGGSGTDGANQIVVDSAGNMYVAGQTNSTDLTPVSAVQATPGGNFDGFVLKLDPTGTTVLYLTYLGGPGFDDAFSIALDDAGNAHVTGKTAGSLPTNLALDTSPQPTIGGGGGTGAYAAKLNASGNQLLYLTYLGGASNEDEGMIAVDAAGSAYVTMGTFASGLASSFPFAGGEDAYVVKLGTRSADVSVTKFGNPSPVLSNTNLTYTITVHNSGPDPAINVLLSDTVPAGTTFQSLTPNGGCATPAVNGTGSIDCALGTLANGATVVFTLVVKVTAASGSVSNTASIKVLTPDPNSANDSATSLVSITQPGAISGTVFEGAGAPNPGTGIAGALITVFNSDSGFRVATGTTSNGIPNNPPIGTYTISGLPPGNYKVSAEVDNRVVLYFNNKTNLTGANLVSVSGGNTTGGINFVLSVNAGSISGKVTLTDGSTPVPNAAIAIKTPGGDAVLFSTPTDGNGNYNTQRRLAAGSYLVRVSAPGFPITYFVSATNVALATQVVVGANADTTGINVKLSLAVGGISGTVTSAATGAPLAGIGVSVYDAATGGFIQGFTTNNVGRYDTGQALAPGQYKVTANVGGSETIAYSNRFSVATGDPVTVASGTTSTGIDIALPLLGGITGHVRNSSNAPIQNAIIDVRDYASNTFLTSTTTAPDGSYTISNLNPLQAYQVRARMANFGLVFFNNKPSAGTADVVTVPAGGNATLDFVLGAAGGITGTVTDAGTGQPIQGVTIDVLDGASTNLSINNFVDFAVTTAANGTFNTGRVLPPGAYKLRARKVNSGYIQTFYHTVPNGFDLSTAATLPVIAGADTPNANIAMALGGTITGTIRDRASNQPLSGATVRIRRVASSGFFGDFATTTDANGNYTLTGIHTGEWLLTAEATGHMFGWYSGDPNNLATDFASSLPIQITGTSTVPNVNLNLPLGGGEIRGRVTRTDSGQAVPPGTVVSIRGPWPRSSAVSPSNVLTNEQGDFSISGVPPGRYLIEADRFQMANGTAIGFFPLGAISRITGIPVTVTDGGVLTTDFQVVGFSGNATPRAIRGTLKAPGNIPLREAFIFAFEPTGNSLVRVTTAFDDGTFVMDGLPPGRYVIHANTEKTFVNTNFPAELTANTATVIDVTAGDAAGINLVLPDTAGTITGTITRSDNGQPILGASVSVRTFIDASPSGATSRADGTYLIRGVAAGFYKIRASAPGFVTKYFVLGVPGGARSLEDGSFVSIGGTNLPNIDVVLDPTGGALTGTVKRQDTLQSLVATTVGIFDAVTGNRVFVVITDATGTWRTEGLGAGNYKLVAVDVQDNRYALRWHNGQSTLLSADPVAVASAGVTGGIDMLVSPIRGTISGHVSKSDESALANSAVVILDSATGGLVRRVQVGSTGNYAVQGLAPGSSLYVAQGRALGFADQFFSDQFFSGVPIQTIATPLTVTSGATTPNVGFFMTASADITGSVSYGGAQTGTLVVRLFSDAAFTQQVYETKIPSPNFVDVGPSYSFALPAPDSRGLLPGQYFVKAFLDSNGNGVLDPTEAVGTGAGAVTVAEGTVSPGVNITMTDPPATTNTAPVADTQSVIVLQGSPNNSIILTGHDTQTAMGNLTFVATNPLHGTLGTTANSQQRLYTPTPGFSGDDTFSFTVTDRGDPDGCGPPGPTCSAPLTSAPATVSIKVTPNTGTTSAALSGPAIVAPSQGSAIGDIQIAENGVGALAPGSAITLSLPAGLTFSGTPTVSLRESGGAALNSPIVSSGAISFTLAAASTSGKATILVSGMAVDVSPGFLPEGVTSAALLTTISGPNPGVTPATVQNATIVTPVAGPIITSVSPATTAQGATGRVVVIAGANFANDATASFGSGVTAGVSVDSPSRITATLNVALGAAPGARDVTVTNVGAAQSTTKLGALQITNQLPTVVATTGPLAHCDNQLVTIIGTGFMAPTTTPSDFRVSFSGAGITVLNVGYTSDTTATAIVGVADAAPETTSNVTVTNPDGGSATGLGIVSVGSSKCQDAPPPKNTNPPPPPPPPTISSLSAGSGPIGSSLTINGSGFGSAPSVTFAGANNVRVPGTVTGSTSSSVTVTVPPPATTGSVTVTAGGLVSNGATFAVTTPVLAAVLPSNITTNPNTTNQAQLTFSGGRFSPGAIVSFAGPVGDVTPVGTPSVSPDGTAITLMVSLAAVPQQSSPRDVTVTNPGVCSPPAVAGCLSSTIAGGLQVQPPPPASFVITLPDFPDSSTYLPSITQVSFTRLATGACDPTTKVVTPTGVRLQAQFVTGVGLTPPGTVTFSITPSALAGTATNEDCELDPANPAKDFSIGTANLASQQVTVQDSGGGVYQTMLFSYDWGGKVTVTVTGITAGVTATKSQLFPVDTDGDDLPDAYEKNAALNADVTGANVLNFQNPDQNANGVRDRDDRFARDGLSNFEKYRGVYMVGPIPGGSGALGGFQRLGAGFRHFFVRGRGFRDDPAVPTGFCGINPATGAPVADPTLSADNPCPAFQIGTAFLNIGVAVHNVTSSFTASTELPRTSFLTPAQPTLDMATVVYDGVNCKGSEPCDTISKFGVRQWGNSTLGYTTPNGTATTYGLSTIYKRAIECYFNCYPYQHRINDPTRVVIAPDGTPMLAPITKVGDSASGGADNGAVNTGEATINGQLAGDTYIPGSFNQQLSALDVNSDRCIELPTVADPTTIARCTSSADTAAAPSATKQMVIRSVVTHEMGHLAAIAAHTTDPTDIMYQSTINFIRDGHFSDTAAGLVQIHNKGLQ